MASTWPELHAGTTFGYVWDAGTLAWVKATAAGGGGTGLTDTELRASPVPVSISGSIAVTGPLTDVQLRATAVPISGTVAISGSVAVTGPLTDTQLRATAVPVSGTFFQGTQPVSIAATVAVSATQLPAALGQTTKINSLPVTLPSDIGTLVVSSLQLPLALVSSGLRVSVQSALGSSTIPVAVSGVVAVGQVFGVLNDPVEVGIGNTGFGTQRVVLASDQPAVAISGSVTASAVADVLAPDGTAAYTVAQTGKKLTQTYDGRLRVLSSGYVGTEYQDSTPRSPLKALPLSSDGLALRTRDDALHGILEELLGEVKKTNFVLGLGFGLTL